MAFRMISFSPENETKHEEHNEYVEQNFGDFGGTRGDSSETEYTGDNRNYDENNWPSKHNNKGVWWKRKTGFFGKKLVPALSEKGLG